MEADEKPIHVFTTQFFSRLEDEGVNAVTSWTAKKRIDIFEKKFIFIPVNKDIHWSLLVVVNPGKMINSATEELSNKEADVPFILFLDSLRAHKKKKLKVLIYKWLNSEARRLGKFNTLEARGPFKDNDAFNSLTMPIMDPRGESFDGIVPSRSVIFLFKYLFFSSDSRQQLGLWSICLQICIWFIASL